MVVLCDGIAKGNTAGDGVRHGSRGVLGGEDSKPHHYVLKSEGRPDRELRTKEVGVEIRPGDRLVIASAGGGGWGDAALRDPAADAEDARNGLARGKTRA